ncbi:hypothetical protein [Stenotrophomonas sp. 24(2023)]|uniref:hypothetical protein n=1 Tax=Stenotrophomonas sp. 24(2023) TaxID=3068324 RepID=UPI0027DEB6C7|nr:hypothetical protein [Stenotrophomonas sp. 24(2023)]WMJ69754.1 hypothetical protein Q9R17_01180 [Stenotrophomonas sp. 24(2023)]
MRRVVLAVLALMAAPAFAAPPAAAYLERQQAAAADAAAGDGQPAAKDTCRVVKEWKVGGVVAQHRVCEDPPKAPPSPPVPATKAASGH